MTWFTEQLDKAYDDVKTWPVWMRREAGLEPMMKYYTGIGSRQTPEEYCLLMTDLARELEKRGWILRSGGADGADSAFEAGVEKEENKQIFLPWKRFNTSTSPRFKSLPGAFTLASQIHPVWDQLSFGAKALHARNIHQVLGDDLQTPSRFLICWTLGAGVTGGTATAIKVAWANKVPVINLAIPESLPTLDYLLKSIEDHGVKL